MMLDYGALSALAAVIREGSFERAAQALGITPSAVSQRIKGLEDRLGCVLIIRGQPSRPTEVGARLFAHSERVRLMEGDLSADLRPLGAGQQGARPVLRVALNVDSLSSWFPLVAARFAASSDAMLDLVLDDEGHTAEKLRAGEVLAAVTADPQPVQGCRLTPLGALSYVATATPAFMARHFPDGVTPEALARAPVLRFNQKDQLQARWAESLGRGPLNAPAHWVPTTQGFLDFSLAGVGWALNPVLLVAGHIKAGRLVELEPGHGLSVPLFWQANRLDAHTLRLLTDTVRAVAREVLDQGGTS